MRTPPRAVLFDLDGTLADTAPDLAHALNRLLAEERRPPLALDDVRPHVAGGSHALIALGFGTDLDCGTRTALRERLLALYRAGIARETRLFPGIEAVLDALDARGLAWGVVTDKPGWLTRPLLDALGIACRASCVVSGDSVTERKPHPAPLLAAAAALEIAPAACVYIGDTRRDADAARAAGMRALIAAWGHLDAGADPRAWPADAVLHDPRAVVEWLAAFEHTQSRPPAGASGRGTGASTDSGSA